MISKKQRPVRLPECGNVNLWARLNAHMKPKPRLKVIHAAKIQEDKYARKTDWDEQERFQLYIKQHNIKLIPYKHYENK